MAIPPTTTLKIRDALRLAQDRAAKTGRTQQVELENDQFVRIAGGGHKFLLFQLEGEPTESEARAVAEVLGYRAPRYGWHQGKTLRSLTVEDEGAEMDSAPSEAG